MKKNSFICTVVALMLSLIVSSSVWAQNSLAEKVMKREAAKNDNEETLFNTLNETLEENRKVRVAMKDMQQALQQKTIESEDLKSELRKLEGLALERNRELGTKIKELDNQIQETAGTATKFEIEKNEFIKEKIRIKKE